MTHPFLDRLARGPILGDGAMGTMLHARGAALDQCLEELCLTHPDWVSDIHLGYIKAGAEIIQTNTFGGSRLRLVEYGLADKVREINFRGVKLAREAREISGQAVWIAGSVGPLGKRARSGGRLRQEEAAATFAEQMGILWEAGADLLILETFSDLDELAVAVQVARKTTDLPVVAEVTLGNDGVTTVGRRTGRGGALPGCAGRGRGGRQLLAGAGAHAGVHRRDAWGRAGAASGCHAQRRTPLPGWRADGLPLSAALLRRTCAAIPGSGHVVGRRLLWHDARAHPGDACCARRSGAAGGAGCGSCRCSPSRWCVSHRRPSRRPRRKLRRRPASLRSCARASSWSASRWIRRAASARPRCSKARASPRSTAPTPSTWPTARWRACAWARWRCAC